MWITARCAGPAVLLLGLPSCAEPAAGPVLLLGVLSWAGPAGCAVLCWACQVAAGLLRMLGDLLWRFSSCHAVGKQRHRGICNCDPLPLPSSTACRPPCWTSSARARWRRARLAASLRCGLQENACPAAWCCAAQCLWPRRLPALAAGCWLRARLSVSCSTCLLCGVCCKLQAAAHGACVICRTSCACCTCRCALAHPTLPASPAAQAIGAYTCDVDYMGEQKQVTFLDTPGHEVGG